MHEAVTEPGDATHTGPVQGLEGGRGTGGGRGLEMQRRINSEEGNGK